MRAEPLTFPLAETSRSWSKVDKGVSGCWLWTAVRNRLGYGHFSAKRLGKKSISSHRYSWLLHRGPIPTGAHVLHRCDVRNCVNPDHLFLGTHRENMRDMIAKGRANKVRGAAVFGSKLSEDQVREIRRRRAMGEQGKALAAAFGVTPTQITAVAKRKVWKHVG